MNYCGLDLSLSGTGLIILDSTGQILLQQLIKTKASQVMEERFDNILYEIDDKVVSKFKTNEYIINMEGLSFGSSGQSMLELAGLHYIIRHFFYIHKVNYIVTPPTKVKKFVTGKGNCKKNLMLLNVYKKFGITFDDDNIADAYCLAQLNLHDNWIPKS